MKKYLFITITLLFTFAFAFAEDTTEFKKNLITSCVASGNAQLSCECAVTGFENELTPEAWEAIRTLNDPKRKDELDKLSEGKTIEFMEGKSAKLFSLLDDAEEQMDKIATDCNVNKDPANE